MNLWALGLYKRAAAKRQFCIGERESTERVKQSVCAINHTEGSIITKTKFVPNIRKIVSSIAFSGERPSLTAILYKYTAAIRSIIQINIKSGVALPHKKVRGNNK